jgi:amino acid adenylation domain-containing protein
MQQRHRWVTATGGAAGAGIEGTIYVEGDTSVERIVAAALDVMQRHEILRTRLWHPPAMRWPLQVVDDAAGSGAIAQGDLRDLDEASRLRRLAHLRQQLRDRVGIASGPPVALTVVLLADARLAVLVACSPFVADAVTLRLLVDELGRAYAKVGGVALPECPVVQYADYAAWQQQGLAERRRQLGAEESEVALAAALRRALAGAADSPARGAAGPDSVRLTVPSVRAAQLAAMARTCDAGVRDVLMAAWVAWLWRTSRIPRMTVAQVVDGRAVDELRGALGPFARRIPAELELDGATTFAELVRASAAAVARGEAEAETFEELPAFLPAAQFEFASAAPDCYYDGARFWLAETPADTPVAEVALACSEQPDGIQLELRANIGASAVLDQLAALLDGVAQTPEAPIDELPLLDSGAEREHVLAQATGSPLRFPRHARIHELFEAQTLSTPDRVAVAYGDDRWTFAELNARANRVAGVLREHGVGRGSLVGICIERSLDLFAALLGTLKTGGAYVPLDPGTLNPGRPGYPEERLAFMLRDTGVPVLLAQRALIEGLPETDTMIVAIDDPERFEGIPGDDVAVEGSGGDLAYAIYTSGSTGRPKAALVEHRMALNLWSALREQVYSVRAGERLTVSLNSPIGFDPSVQQLLALLDGHTLVLVPERIRSDGSALLELIDRDEIDVWDCTPPQLRLLLRAGLLDAARSWPSIVICGGEAMDADIWGAIATADRPAVFNVYGPTECTVDATCTRVRGDAPTIGSPLPNVRVHVLDGRRQPVPPGIPGEMYIGGAGVARGYLNRPELTEERFVADPFGGEGSRLYRTGDLAVARSDGTLDFLGRLDDQVKVRSHRIELAEVETVVRQCPGVQDTAAVVREDTPGDRRLVAYYVLEAGATTTNSTIRAHLKRWVPEYMVPAALVPIDSLPLSSRGKLDRAALPLPTQARAALGIDFVAPRDEFERRLVAAWASVLELAAEEIGVRDDFFDLGGDSLRAVELLTALEETVGHELPLDVAVTAPTVEQQAVALR